MPDEPEFDREEQLAAMRAAVDQVKESMHEVAAMVFTYYSELMEAGFETDQAFALTMAYQTTVLQSGGSA